MENKNSVDEIVHELQKYDAAITINGNTQSDLKRSLSIYLNHLIITDFSRLLTLLYLLDVSEKKLSQLLHSNGSLNAGDLIADLVIERQLQKIETRKQFTAADKEIPDEERW